MSVDGLLAVERLDRWPRLAPFGRSHLPATPEGAIQLHHRESGLWLGRR